MKKKYKITVDCANCASKMESQINGLKGVKEATINFMAEKLIVEYEDGAIEDEIFKDIVKICKKIDSDVEFN